MTYIKSAVVFKSLYVNMKYIQEALRRATFLCADIAYVTNNANNTFFEITFAFLHIFLFRWK